MSQSWTGIQFSQFSHSVVSDSLQPHGLQHARPLCPSPAPGVYSNSCPLSWWCHPTTSSSVVPFFSCLQSFPASGSFPMSKFFASGGQSIGVSASTSVPPMNTQDWFPLGWTGWISLLSKSIGYPEMHSMVAPELQWDPRDSTVHGILLARMLEWIAIPFSSGSSRARDRTQVSRIAGGCSTSSATREAQWVQRSTVWPRLSSRTLGSLVNTESSKVTER